MDRLHGGSFGVPREQDDTPWLDLEEVSSPPTPGQIIGQIGVVISICLGLGLLARVMIGFIGVH